jgi:hypothetical protein
MMKLRAFFVAGIVAAAGSQAADLDFDKTFNARGEARQLNYRATYLANGSEHQVEIWRDRDQRLKRRTDDKLETYIFKPARQAEWNMVVLDLQRKMRTDIGRTNLFRIGHFTDWFSMSHALTRPTGSYQLTELKTAPVSGKPLSACRWYALKQGEAESHICWSAELRLPLLISDAHGNTMWRVTAASKQPLPANVFAVHDADFMRNDANADIQTD